MQTCALMCKLVHIHDAEQSVCSVLLGSAPMQKGGGHK